LSAIVQRLSDLVPVRERQTVDDRRETAVLVVDLVLDPLQRDAEVIEGRGLALAVSH